MPFDVRAAALRALEDAQKIALDSVGREFAAALQDAAPAGPPRKNRQGGPLINSIRYVPGTNTRAHVEMVWYGEVVDAGKPGTTQQGVTGRPITMRPLSRKRSAVLARRRYRAQVGRQIKHPNPFVQRAWNSSRVKAALRSVPFVISRG